MKSLLIVLCCVILGGCAVYKDKQGQTHYEVLPPAPDVSYAPPPPPPPPYYAPPPPPYYYAPPPPGVYYAPAPPPAVVYRSGGGGPNPQHERSKHVQANCNTAWTGCVNVCNTLADANQRALCISNCNNARNQCIKKNLGY